MASKTSARAFRSLARANRPSCVCQRPAVLLQSSSTSRPFSNTSRIAQDESLEIESEAPRKRRWATTPPQMTAPFPMKARDPEKVFKINEDPEMLDAVYVRFLGRGGDKLLPEDIKWLAVTHKSFDGGRRGFNDKLAFYGRRFVQLQATTAMLSAPITGTKPLEADAFGRIPYEDAALESLRNIEGLDLGNLLSRKAVANLAFNNGIGRVMRWQPKNVNDLSTSGIDVVANMALYGIIGAVALHNGGAVAAQLTREKILKPLKTSATYTA